MPNAQKRKQTIKITEKINEMENKQNQQRKINETQYLFFEILTMIK